MGAIRRLSGPPSDSSRKTRSDLVRRIAPLSKRARVVNVSKRAFHLDETTVGNPSDHFAFASLLPPSPILGPMIGLCLVITAFKLPDLGLRRPSESDRWARPWPRQPHEHCRQEALKARASLHLFFGPWTAGFAKAGSVFWPLLRARHRECLQCGVKFGGHLADPGFPSRRFFPRVPRLATCASALSLVPWLKHRSPSCVEPRAQLPGVSKI